MNDETKQAETAPPVEDVSDAIVDVVSDSGVVSVGAAPVPAAAAPGGDPALGSFGKYRLVQKLALGGMAQIYLASIDGPDGFSKACVVKTILPEFAALQDFNEMFVNEAKVAAILHHPNIVQVYDFGRENNRYFLAMEFVDGCSLQQLLREAAKAGMTLGPRYALGIGQQICDAMSYVQNVKVDGKPLGLVHRDLTLGNILISGMGVAKLTDFGVVKSGINPNATSTGVVKGKYPYMSPEQIQGEAIDHRSDIFSLGIVLFEVSTGRRLFKRPSLAETIVAVSSAEVRRPSEIIPNFPVEFERILLKALARNKEDRFQSFREFGQALDAFRTAKAWTSSTRELASLMETLFPPGSNPAQNIYSSFGGNGTGTGSGPTTPTDEDDVPSVMGGRSDLSGLMGPVEIGLAAVALLLIAVLAWFLAFG